MSPALLLFSAGVCLTLGVGQAQLYREDGRCGPNYPAPGGGGPAQCEYIAPFPTCCQASEYCGWDCDDGKEQRFIRDQLRGYPPSIFDYT